jgi:hypothetical protein
LIRLFRPFFNGVCDACGVLGQCPGSACQTSWRTAPVIGPDVTTIGGIATTARLGVGAGPSAIFPVIGTLCHGTRGHKGLRIGGSARGCQFETMDSTVSRYLSGKSLVEGNPDTPDDNLVGGPDYRAARGLAQSEHLGGRGALSVRILMALQAAKVAPKQCAAQLS